MPTTHDCQEVVIYKHADAEGFEETRVRVRALRAALARAGVDTSMRPRAFAGVTLGHWKRGVLQRYARYIESCAAAAGVDATYPTADGMQLRLL